VPDDVCAGDLVRQDTARRLEAARRDDARQWNAKTPGTLDMTRTMTHVPGGTPTVSRRSGLVVSTRSLAAALREDEASVSGLGSRNETALGPGVDAPRRKLPLAACQHGERRRVQVKGGQANSGVRKQPAVVWLATLVSRAVAPTASERGEARWTSVPVSGKGGGATRQSI